ncbi:MAG: AAA family ATPase, partial [Candidatus Lokiarchaeia archaeon]
MNHNNSPKAQVLYTPCPPEEFSGRFNERKKLLEIISQARHQGQMVMVSGARGSGKSSFLNWVEYEIQNKSGGLESPAIKNEFLETPGMIFATYRALLTELRGHQKFGWFRKALAKPKVKKSIEVLLGILESGSTMAGPAKIGINAGTAVAKKLLSAQHVEYTQLLTSFLTTLRILSDEMIENNQFIAILFDDAQWSSEPDFLLLKDLVRNLPPGIAFVFTFRLEADHMDSYTELRSELVRFGYSEISLSGMDADEIKELAGLRYDWSIDDSTAKFLSKNIGDPFCLVSCFNLLQSRNLEPNLDNFQTILPESVNPAQCIYSELEQQWKKRVDSLCILHPPLALSLIGCMLNIKEEDMAELQDEFDHSIVFRRLERESYDFAHASLREYRRKELPESSMIRLHSQAAKCLESLKERLLDKWFVAISLAEHLFYGQQYEKALALNLQLGDELYDLFDFHLALQLTERAKTCAEKTNNKYKLASALHQKGLILQSIFRFPDS